jgi:hypothetical protein
LANTEVEVEEDSARCLLKPTDLVLLNSVTLLAVAMGTVVVTSVSDVMSTLLATTPLILDATLS